MAHEMTRSGPISARRSSRLFRTCRPKGTMMTVNMKSLTLPIQGMTCASCVAHVERALTEVPGASNVVVNLAMGKANLTYDPARAYSRTGHRRRRRWLHGSYDRSDPGHPRDDLRLVRRARRARADRSRWRDQHGRQSRPEHRACDRYSWRGNQQRD